MKTTFSAIVVLSFALVGCNQKAEVEAAAPNQNTDEVLMKIYKGQGCKKARTIKEIQRDRERGESSCKKD